VRPQAIKFVKGIKLWIVKNARLELHWCNESGKTPCVVLNLRSPQLLETCYMWHNSWHNHICKYGFHSAWAYG
jgi:hypothetical protein